MVEKKFGALRFVSGLFKVLAWIELIGSIIGAVIVIIMGIMGTSNSLSGITALGLLGSLGAGIGLIIGGLIMFVVLKAVSEIYQIIVAIEYSTRETAYLMRGEQQQGGMAPPPMR